MTTRKDFIKSLITGKNKNKDTRYIQDIYKPVKPDEKDIAPTFPRIKHNMWNQCDVLFLPADKGYEYALVVVDVGSRKVDAEPLKEKSSAAVVKAIKAIYKRKILLKPKLMSVDAGSEFKSVFKKAMIQLDIELKVAKAGRHRQVSLVERKNQTIGKTIHKIITRTEFETGRSSSAWVDDLPDIVESINEHISKSVPKKTIKTSAKLDPLYNTSDIKLLKVGDKVRVPLEAPKDLTTKQRLNGKFRSGDIRWDINETKITEVLLKPNMPPLYIVESQPNVGYTANQLQRVKRGHDLAKRVPVEGVENRYTVSKLLDRKKIRNTLYYLVKWKGKSIEENPSWEKRKDLIKDIPRLIKNLDKKLDNKD